MWAASSAMSTTWSTWMRAHHDHAGRTELANAFAALYQEVAGGQAIQAQPFFEAALARRPAPRTPGVRHCTAAVVEAAKKRRSYRRRCYNPLERAERGVFLDAGAHPAASPGTPGSAVTSAASQILLELAGSTGWGNYNAALPFLHRPRIAIGLTARSNFTWRPRHGNGRLGAEQQRPTVVESVEHAGAPTAAIVRYPVVYNLALV